MLSFKLNSSTTWQFSKTCRTSLRDGSLEALKFSAVPPINQIEVAARVTLQAISDNLI